jgi:hypothetical protein
MEQKGVGLGRTRGRCWGRGIMGGGMPVTRGERELHDIWFWATTTHHSPAKQCNAGKAAMLMNVSVL